MKAQILILFSISFLYFFVLTLVQFTEFSKGVIKLLLGVWTLSFVYEQNEQVRADRHVGSVRSESSCLTAMFEL